MRCILAGPAAKALAAVQRKLAEKKLSLIIWDCYRPKRAVEDFLQRRKDSAHAETKAEFYPRTDRTAQSANAEIGHGGRGLSFLLQGVVALRIGR